VLVQHIVFEGSLDSYMVSKVVAKQEVIDAANAHGMAMVFTGMRHFRH
jgi:hypothetical protein